MFQKQEPNKHNHVRRCDTVRLELTNVSLSPPHPRSHSQTRRPTCHAPSSVVNVTEKTLQESEDELKDIISNAIFLKPIASIKSCSILHSVEDLSTDSTFVYKNRGSGYDSQRNSKRLKQRNEEMYNRIHQQKHQQPQDILLPPKTEQPQLPQPPQSQGLTKTTTAQQDTGNADSTEKAPLKSEWIIGGDGGGGIGGGNQYCPLSQNRGLSKSMIIPTPARDLSNIFDDEYEEYSDGLLDKISQ